MRVALVGYGAVAELHARGLKGCAELASVVGPDRAKADRFASAYGAARAETEIDAGLRGVDAAIICSPSAVHYQQAAKTVQARVNTLVELPACSSHAEAVRLAEAARSSGVLLQCAHTARYLEPYRLLGGWIASGVLGELHQATYTRSFLPRVRSWNDDALLHHAEHPLDLFLLWFGSVTPLGCAGHPGIPGAQNVSLLASAAGNAPLAISISYTSRLAETKMTITGSRHTVATDGFSYVASDGPALTWRGDAQQTYEQAIAGQDKHFLAACQTGQGGVRWDETLNLTARIEEFSKLWKSNR